ncbi:hypothetical protein [Paenibacillus silvisoli]|uniref:hypothetical protein n=1 Tax=Paenibacillus silvisoli TaxID=3110539 RepID=UPI0028050A1C|nr:hypothetical protein [Paenibacillus silvisoli]
MEPIYPLHEDHISRFCGMPVCAVTHDGERHFGVLTRCHGGKLMFNEREGGALQHKSTTAQGPQGKVTNMKTAKGKTKKGKKAVTEAKEKEAAQTQAYYPYDPYFGDPYSYGYGPYWGDAFALDLASLAFLFLLI